MGVRKNVELEGKKLKQWRKECRFRKGQKVRYAIKQEHITTYRDARVIKKYETYILLEDVRGYKVCVLYTEPLLKGWTSRRSGKKKNVSNSDT